MTAEVAHPRGTRSLSSHLRSRVGIAGVKAGLLQEWLRRARPAPDAADPALLAGAIKALPLTLVAARPLDEAISSAGGQLLTARFASGHAAGDGVLCWLSERRREG